LDACLRGCHPNFQKSPTKPMAANAASASGTVFGRQLGLRRSPYITPYEVGIQQ
jgi:hypothetical protein